MITSRRVIDAHAHLWRRARTPQPWIDPATMSAIDADFWKPDLERMQAETGTDGTIVVQSSNDPVETRDLLRIADGRAIRGVVGWISLEGDVAGQVEQVRSGRGGGHLVGVRHLVHQDPDPGWLVRSDVAAGLEMLGRLGLPFDLVVLPTQLQLAAQVVSDHPAVRFVLDHLGKPPIAGGDLDTWQVNLAAIAASPNVVAKISGLTIEADWSSWTIDDIRPVLQHALEVFGTERLLFGTDWPLVALPGSAGGWLAVARELIPEAAHSAVFADNATDTYLPDDLPG